MAFKAKSTVKIFSNVVFLVVTIGGYPGMVPICQPNFEITTDISSDLCDRFVFGLFLDFGKHKAKSTPSPLFKTPSTAEVDIFLGTM